jgi:hypothetical protein
MQLQLKRTIEQSEDVEISFPYYIAGWDDTSIARFDKKQILVYYKPNKSMSVSAFSVQDAVDFEGEWNMPMSFAQISYSRQEELMTEFDEAWLEFKDKLDLL